MQSPQAVIEIGSTGIRMLVAEVTPQKNRTILDRSELPVNIGRDVFTTGSISRETQSACLQILGRFQEQLQSYRLAPAQTILLGTSAVREAANRDPFVDRIKVKTGLTVRVIDGIEENRLMYIAVTECLKDSALRTAQDNSIILEVAGGSTEMMLMEKGRMAGAHSLRLGTVIIEQQVYALTGSYGDERHLEYARRFLQEFIRNTRASLDTELNLNQIQQFIMVGNDVKVAAQLRGKRVAPFLWHIRRSEFDAFVDEVQDYPIDLITAKFKLSYADAQTFQVSLLAYKEFISLTTVGAILVPDISIRDGVLISRMVSTSDELQQEFDQQIIASATTLLRKYHGDELHAQYVRTMSLRLYDAMKNELGLTTRERLLLEVSAILHDVGMFIRASDHNLHSQYIITNSEIFGLSHDDTRLVAQVAAHHRGSRMPQDTPEFKLLPRATRLTILKLTAILRVADALDRGHQQKLTNFAINLSKGTITFRASGQDNLGLEKLALSEKGEMFENVFGYRIVLV